MNESEYEAFRRRPVRPDLISVDDVDETNGTLAYGYTTDRDTWHAYVEDEKIHIVIYGYAPAGQTPQLLFHDSGYAVEAERLRPNKRVYPDTVDRSFAEAMRDRGFELPFLGNFDFNSSDVRSRATRGPFKGKRVWELDDSLKR